MNTWGGDCSNSEQGPETHLLVIPAVGGAEQLLTWAEFWIEYPEVDTDELAFMRTVFEADMTYEFRYRGVTRYVRVAPDS